MTRFRPSLISEWSKEAVRAKLGTKSSARPVLVQLPCRVVFIKVCGVTNSEDALLAAGLGADAVGMIFAASKRRITTGTASDIVRHLPAETMAVGVFLDESRERVIKKANEVGLVAVQLHGSESIEDTRWLAARIPTVIKAFSATNSALRRAADYGAHHILIDSAVPGSGKVFDWAVLEQAPSNLRFILAGGLNPRNVADAVTSVKPWGIDVATGVEKSPGRKDAKKLRQFIAAARAAEPKVDEYLDNDDSPKPRPFNWEEDRSWR